MKQSAVATTTTTSRQSPKDLALSYVSAGIPVFPCRHENVHSNEVDPDTGELITYFSKSPLVPNGFKGATKNTPLVGRMWDRYPHAVVGIPTGEQIDAWVLDVDVHEEEDGTVVNGYETIEALEAKYGELPAEGRAQTAGGGCHHYFKHVPGLRNRGALGRGLDVRGSGGYVIAPGSTMGNGKTYEWLDYDGDGPPPLPDAPAWLLELVMPRKPESQTVYTTDGSNGFGDNPAYVSAAVQDELDQLATAPQGTRNNALNDAAYAIGRFVGAGAYSESDARQQLEEIAHQWPNFPKSKGTINRGLNDGMDNPRTDIPAAPQQHDNSTPPIDTTRMIANSLAPKKAAPSAVNDNEVVEPEVEEDDTTPEYALEVISDLESLTYPGGLVEDLIDWIVSSAEQPSRTLALAAVLPLVSTLAGARFSTGNRDTRPNIYTVALAESGFGKEHARSQIKRLLMEGRGVFDKFGGPARIMSASALREVLETCPSVNCQIDEFGGFVRDITDRNAGGHQRAISTDLRDYYSASSTYFEGAAYRGSPPKRIYNPNLCIHGTSTPDQFWSALSSASAEDGLLPRLILFLVDSPRTEPVKPQYDVRWVPTLLLERMAEVAGIDVAKERSALSRALDNAPKFAENKPKLVPWTVDALLLFSSIKEAIDSREARVAPEARPFIRRIIENTIKLALIVAVGTDSKTPEITEANVEWAASVAWSCAATMISQVSDRLADNQREANYKRIASIIKAAGKTGIPPGKLVDKLKSIDARQREEIIKDLRESGKVADFEAKTKGRPSKRLVWTFV